jgi:hypothetical protein
MNSKNLPNGVPCTHSNPLRNGSILFQFLGKLALDNKCLMGRLKQKAPKKFEKMLHLFEDYSDKYGF